MNSEKILDAMEFVNEDYINQVYTLKQHPKSFKLVWIKYISIAACVIIAIFGALSQEDIRDILIGSNDDNDYLMPSTHADDAYDVNIEITTDNNNDEDLNAGSTDNSIWSGNSNKPPQPPVEEPTTEEPTTEEPTTEELTTEEPTTEEPTLPTEDLPLGTTKPLFAYVRVVSASEDKYIIKIIDNKGNDELVEGEKYEVTCNIYDDSVDELKVGRRFHIMCAYDGEQLVVYSIKK